MACRYDLNTLKQKGEKNVAQRLILQFMTMLRGQEKDVGRRWTVLAPDYGGEIVSRTV